MIWLKDSHANIRLVSLLGEIFMKNFESTDLYGDCIWKKTILHVAADGDTD